MDMQAGVAYGIIVDGFDGKFGTFDLAMTATQVPPPSFPPALALVAILSVWYQQEPDRWQSLLSA
jgi:hypothetical protein